MVNEIARVITDIVVEHVTEPRTKLFRVAGDFFAINFGHHVISQEIPGLVNIRPYVLQI